MRTILILLFLSTFVVAKKAKEKPKWAQKDIRDFSDADMERLLDQWEEDEEPLEEDELPEHMRKPPEVDMSKLPSDPESVLKQTKKGRTLMTFVSLDGKPTREETEQITALWQGSLRNNHIQAERYVLEDDRVLFVFSDGSQAWEAKDFLVDQERCASVTIENREYTGKHKKDEL